MRFGVCTGLENLDALTSAGFDYIELGIASVLQPERPDDAVMPGLRAHLEESSLRPEAYNVLLPRDIAVVGPSVDSPRQDRYLESAFARARSLGGEIVVFGSGGSRNVPEGFSTDEANRQIQEFLRRAGDAAVRHGLTVAIEPLNRNECNLINSVGEGVALARAVSHPAVAVLSDLYHVTAEGQSYDETRDAGPLLKHVHVAGRENRRAPMSGDLSFLTEFFRAVKKSGYEGRISIEGGWTDLPAQAPEARDTLHRAWEAA